MHALVNMIGTGIIRHSWAGWGFRSWRPVIFAFYLPFLTNNSSQHPLNNEESYKVERTKKIVLMMLSQLNNNIFKILSL